VILSHGFAGSERAVAEACNAMCGAQDVALALRRDDWKRGGSSIRDYLDPGVELIDLPGRPGTHRALRAAIDSWRPDVIHTHLRRATRLIAQIGADAAHLCTVHLSINGPHYLRSDGIICMTDCQLATIPSDYRGQRFLIRNSLVPEPPIGAERVRELRAGFGAADGDFVIGGVGRIVPGKVFDLLIDAFERAALPAARVVIVGDGRELWRLRSLAGPRVDFTGFRNDAKNCFRAFDLFVSPSRREPFGRVIIEALDAGTPVVATDVQGPPDIARRYPIELVPSEDAHALAQALRRAFERPRERMRVDLSEFHVDHITARMLEAYRATIAARSDAPRKHARALSPS
jgi:glycosyltransferase involved in cell wall biosynthesis